MASTEARNDHSLVLFPYESQAFKHYHYDTFEAMIERFNRIMKLSFFTNTRGDVETLSAPMEPVTSTISSPLHLRCFQCGSRWDWRASLNTLDKRVKGASKVGRLFKWELMAAVQPPNSKLWI